MQAYFKPDEEYQAQQHQHDLHDPEAIQRGLDPEFNVAIGGHEEQYDLRY